MDLEAQVWVHGGVHGSWASVGPRQSWRRCVCVYACVSVHIYTLLLSTFISVPGPSADTPYSSPAAQTHPGSVVRPCGQQEEPGAPEALASCPRPRSP